MKDIVFIIPYFGKFNNYFQLFLNSCKYNQNCDWLIFTDDKTEYNYPNNVRVVYTTFEKIKTLFVEKFDFNITLDSPYKLCDYKPAYGYLFSEYISEYRFWGHCDTDLIWGNIDHFINDKILKEYEKIFIYGHCTLYRNTKKNNTSFMLELNGVQRYKEVFTTNLNCSFDEEYNSSINNIYEQYKIPVFKEQFQANVYTKSSNFKLTYLNMNKMSYQVEKPREHVFIWDKGELIRYRILNGNLNKEEYLYLHLQSRSMQNNVTDDCRRYKIIPNSFEDIEVDKVTKENFKLINKKHFNLHYFRLRFKNLKIKIRRKFNSKGI